MATETKITEMERGIAMVMRPREVIVIGNEVTPVTPLSQDTTAIGAGNPIQVGNDKTLRIEVWGTGTYAVQIEGIGNSGTARALPVWDISGNAFVPGNSITKAGFYDIDVQALASVRANVTSITGGNVNAAGGLIS